MKNTDIPAYLAQYGYLHYGEDIQTALAKFQSYYAETLDSDCKRIHNRPLIIDGEIGPATFNLIETPRCGCPDFVYEGAPLYANWPKTCRLDLKVYIQTQGLRVNDGEALQAFRDGLDSWEDVIKVGFTEVDTVSGSQIWNDVAGLSGGTLAWSYLATNNCRDRLQQRYNSRVNWSQQYLQAVVAHEYGHALGSGHLNDPGALMYPYARKSVYKPREADVRQMIRLGYEKAAPTPDPDPDPVKIEMLSSSPDQVVVTFTDGTTKRWDWK